MGKKVGMKTTSIYTHTYINTGFSRYVTGKVTVNWTLGHLRNSLLQDFSYLYAPLWNPSASVQGCFIICSFFLSWGTTREPWMDPKVPGSLFLKSRGLHVLTTHDMGKTHPGSSLVERQGTTFTATYFWPRRRTSVFSIKFQHWMNAGLVWSVAS